MATANASRKRWQRLVYDISLSGLVLILTFGCNYFRPIVKNFQDTEVPSDQIAAIIDGAWRINALWEVKADQEKVLIWKLEESTFSDNRVRQFKLKPAKYEILIEDLWQGLSGGLRPYSHVFKVQLEAGHAYRVGYRSESHFLESYMVRHYWIEDLTTGSAVYE